MSEQNRPTTADFKKRQESGGDWFKMDNQKIEDPGELTRLDLESFSARTQTPLPGSRDADLETSALPSARHAMKDEYSDYVKLAKQGGHQDLLKINGASNCEQNGDKKLKINENDSEYVRMAKTGGHTDLLKMDGVKEEAPLQKNLINENYSTYVKIAKSGGHADLIKTEGVQVAESPRKNIIKDTDSDYVRLAKTGGHQGLLNSDVQPVDTGVSKYKIKDTDSEYIKLAKTGGHANLLASESTSPRPETANSRRNVISETDSSYVKLAKKGGDSNLLKMETAKPAAKSVQYKSSSSDWFQHDEKRAPDAVTTGRGKGVRKESNNNNGHAILPASQEQLPKSGKRYFQPASNNRDAPFALHF